MPSVGAVMNAAVLADAPALRGGGSDAETAERLLLELKGKLGPDLGAPSGASSGDQADILQALVALGYSDKEAALSLKALPAGVGVADGIKLALKALSRG